ncbi:MAG: hypothetical protein IPM42_02370 [Saprospiraceae bacterium]|nr:hypothetical protein [Saprospiraceae bacterium]
MKKYFVFIFEDIYLGLFIHLSLCVASLTAFTYLSTGYKPDYMYVAFTGVATLFYYNFHQSRSQSADTNSLNINRNKWIRYFIILPAFLLLLRFTIYFDWSRLKLVLPASVPGLLYFLPFWKGNKKIRDLPYVKILLISVVFVTLTFTVPLYEKGLALNEIVGLSFGRLFFIAALCISFDIGDMLSDRRMSTITIPTKWGIKNSKYIGTAFLFLAALTDVYFTFYFILEFPALIVSICVYLLSAILLWKSRMDSSAVYYLFAVDGMIGLFSLIYYIFT